MYWLVQYRITEADLTQMVLDDISDDAAAIDVVKRKQTKFGIT